MTTMLYERSKGPKLLPAPQDHALLSEQVSTHGFVSVTALFDADAAHNEIQWFTNFLSEKVGADIEVRVRHWTYHELQHLRPGNVADELAEQTDILLLVTHVDEVLPVAVGRWVAAWLERAGPSSAAVCLVGSSDGAAAHAPVARNLQNACRHAQVEFFVSAFKAQRPKAGTASFPNSRSARLCMCGTRRWGINE
jgi:hypothetical protein